MNLKPTTLDSIFFLYCALIYNENKTIMLPSPQKEVAIKIKKILESARVLKIPMPDHRYQYLLSLLCSSRKDSHHEEVISYIENLTKIEELQPLLKEENRQVKEHLNLYEDTFETVSNLFKNAFDFNSKYETIYVTRNFGKSGMFMPLDKEGYLILGNVSFKPNIRNLIHELLHAQLEEVNIKITQNIKDVINNLPDEIYDNYKKPYAVVEESLIRALVVYLTHKNGVLEPEEFSKEDMDLVLCGLYLDVLKRDNKEIFTKEYLEGIGL